ncbi:MAG: hypothetical protein WCF10_09710 [Polyangiales bacterium]
MTGKRKWRAVWKREHQDSGEGPCITMPAYTALAVIIMVLSADTSGCNGEVTSQSLEVSPQTLTIRQGESAAVRVDFENKSTDVMISTYAIDLPEDQADIAIDTQLCPTGEGSPSCQDWTIRPGLDSVPGEYMVKIGTSADPDTARTVELDLTVVGKELTRTPPAIAVDSAFGVDIERPERAGYVLFVTTDGRLWGFGDNSSGAVRVSYARTDFRGMRDGFLQVQGQEFQPNYIGEVVLISTGAWSISTGAWTSVVATDPRYGGYSYGRRSDGTTWRWGTSPVSESSQLGLFQVMQTVPGIQAISVIRDGFSSEQFLVLDGAFDSHAQPVGARQVYGGGSSQPVLVAITNTPLSGVWAIAGGTEPPMVLQAFFTRPYYGNGYVLKGDRTVAKIYENYSRTGPNASHDGGRRFLYAGDMVGAGWTDITKIAAGDDHFLALRSTDVMVGSDDVVLAAGLNTAGQLGTGNTTDAPFSYDPGDPPRANYDTIQYTNVPVQVQGLDSVTAIAAKRDRSFALRSDGTVWTWGGGILSPVQVQNLDNVRTLGAGYALKNDCTEGGTLWAIQFPEGSPPTASRVPGVGEAPGSGCTLAASFDLPSDPVTLDLASSAGSGAFIVLAVSRVGYEGAIDITFEGCPAGVTCAADPIAAGLDSTTVSFTSDATGPAAGDYDVTIQATGGGITRTKVITVRIQ